MHFIEHVATRERRTVPWRCCCHAERIAHVLSSLGTNTLLNVADRRNVISGCEVLGTMPSPMALSSTPAP
jgi:redox-regulated HSP33 family molecular chaperone